MSPGRPPNPAAPGFGAALRDVRLSRRRGQGTLAVRAGLDATSVSRLERGERTPRRATVLALADALFCSREEKDALLLAAGLAPVAAPPAVDALADEPELAAALAVLSDPAVSEGRKAWLRLMIAGLVDGLAR